MRTSTLHPPRQLDRILERTAALGFNMGSEPGVGALLRALVASKPGGRFLELGTGTGIGSAWMLDGMDAASTLVSVDVDAAAQQIARSELGADPRLHLVQMGALEYLRGERGFDLIFADALAGKYEGLDDALAAVKPGGFYVIDDLFAATELARRTRG